MITLKKGALEHYVKAQRRKNYYGNPAYKKRCRLCGAKVLFRHEEIVSRHSLLFPDCVLCPECGQKIDVNKGEGYMSYWRWRLFYEKKCSE